MGTTEVAGQTVGPYTLISQIGQGGMGSVWLAERSDGRFERRVAVKFLNIALVGRGGLERGERSLDGNGVAAGDGRRVVVVHVFSKKTQKTPRREIETALRRAKEVQ